ncbi:hypothetical protein [Methylobacterium oxalidis]|uniref:hypothetical protein n=1 Tax=Methylobacterium oxalidis TaxID=944322 RepID=UPI0033154C40
MADGIEDGIEDGYLYANGVDADTGQPLPMPEDTASSRIADEARGARARDEDEKVVLRHRPAQPGSDIFGTDSSVENPEELEHAGWGVVFPADTDASRYKEALAPLLRLRQAQAGELFRIFEGEAGIRPGEDAADWLARQGRGPGLAAVDPTLGVPFYLLIVASPEQVPMSFQYLLDIFWAVGRLHLSELSDYELYAKSLVDYEKSKDLPQKSRRSVLYATEHSFDRATAMFTRDVVLPFLDDTGSAKPLGRRQGFAIQPILGGVASKKNLLSALADGDGGAPSLLISGTHGMSFRKGDPRQASCQGALVCGDWEGYGAITEDDWFSAADIPADLRLNGMMHFLFACYGGGWESVDTFRDGPDGRGRSIADRPGVAKLPQTLLSRGALSVIAHVDRAWSYSFRTPQGRPQNHPIRDVLTRIMQGKRVGNAIDQFNAQWSALTVPIADTLRDLGDDPAARRKLARLWIARDDVRNYTVLGDPAARIRTDALAAA